ncbi:structure-specific endonuclease subunit EME1 isoform X2 [Mixophyes fleayi]|uniref:structure-specific endonuclease subunit EME1 isoform X2 n=1 Tax=Mixophyes fleayi TaxID=3061075 RepID=UPI003F4D90E8
MSCSAEVSDAEDLPQVSFLPAAARRRPEEVMVVSSSSSEEDEEAPLFQRLIAPSSRDNPARPLGATAPRDPPLRPQKKISAPRDPAKVSQPKRGKKSPETVTVHIDTVLLQDGSGGQVLTALQAQEIHCVIRSQLVPRSITWSRTEGDALCQQEAEILVLVTAEEFLAMIENSKMEPYSDCGKMTLSSFVGRITTSKSCAIPTLVIMEVEKYFRDQNTKSRRKLQEAVQRVGAKERRRKRKETEDLPKLSRVDVEEALMVLQLHTDAHVCFLETWKEFSDYVCMFTKALIEAPTKRQRDNSSLSFYLDGEWAGGVRVERCGKGLLEVWKRQIQQFNRVSVEVSSAVVAAYPSPQLLVKAYQRCRSDTERHNLLSDILVRRGEGVTSTSRRVGPELSKRIYLQLMCTEPELSLDF